MGSVAFDLRSVKGFMVADAEGRYVGHVEAPMYGTQPDVRTRSPSARAFCAGDTSSPPTRSARSTRSPA